MPEGAPAQGPRRTVAALTFATFGTLMATAVLSFVNLLIVARTLGPSGRGRLVFLMTVAYLTAQLASLGVQQANATLAGRYPEHRRALATNSVLFAAALGTLATGVLALLFILVPAIGRGFLHGVGWLALAAIPFLILQTYLQFLLQADYRFLVTNIVWLLPAVAGLLANVAFASAGLLSVTVAFTAWVSGQLVGTLLLAVYVHRRAAGYGRPDRALARRMFAFGIKSHATDIVMWGNYRLDQWYVGASAGARELGLYSAAVSWSETLFFLPSALRSVQRPDLVRAEGAEAFDRAARATRVASLASTPLVLAMLVAAPFLTAGVFGRDFRGSTDDLRVLATGTFGIVAMKLLGNALTAQRRPLLEAAASIVALTLTIALDVTLIPRYGGLGAAVASTVAYSVGGVVVAVIATRALGGVARALLPRRSDLGAALTMLRRR